MDPRKDHDKLPIWELLNETQRYGCFTVVETSGPLHTDFPGTHPIHVFHGDEISCRFASAAPAMARLLAGIVLDPHQPESLRIEARAVLVKAGVQFGKLIELTRESMGSDEFSALRAMAEKKRQK
jgi:hypothetical protein